MRKLFKKYIDKNGDLNIAKMFQDLPEKEKDQILNKSLNILAKEMDKLPDTPLRVALAMICYELTTYLMAKEAE